jgi:hypothetical protein
MRALHDKRHGEVRNDEGPGQAGEGECYESELRLRRGAREVHKLRVAAAGADQRHDRLGRRHGQRQQQGEVACFRDHLPWPTVSCQRPLRFSASATSGGM